MGKKNFVALMMLMILICAGCNREENSKQEAGDVNYSNAIRVLTSKDMITESTHCSTVNGCYLAFYQSRTWRNKYIFY